MSASSGTPRKRIAWPLVPGLLGSGGLALLYFGIVSLAESPAHALELFWDDRWIVLPILGLTAAATFLAQYRVTFMLVGLGTTLLGILFMPVILFKERRKGLQHLVLAMEAA